MLQALVKDEIGGNKPACRHKCDAEFGCKHCRPKGMSVSCPASANSRSPCPCTEWIAGSAPDLIAERELGQAKNFQSETPICMMTANGPNSATHQCSVSVDSIGVQVTPVTPCVLPGTPSVLSIGQRCMEEGFDFVRRAHKRPYLRTPKMDVEENAPYTENDCAFGWIPFTNLTHESQEIQPLTGILRQIMAALTNILRSQVGFALTDDERRNNISATVVISRVHPVEIPAALGTMGCSQMLALLKSAQFSMDRK